MEKKRDLTIGFITSSIIDSFGAAMCKGVVAAAEKYGVNLVVIPGKYINRNLDNCLQWRYEYQYNTLFSYARKQNMDALIVAADCIGLMTSKTNIIRFFAEYKEIPLILLASEIPGYISVNYDNASGIKEGMRHLIEELNCTRIGMVGGPESVSDACARKQVFLEMLAEHNIPFEDCMYAEGNMIKTDNPACKQILDQMPDVEAIFCVNDDSALGLYDEMECRGIEPGRDIKVLGYDDTIYASRVKPSLSSVAADPEKLAFHSLENVLKLHDGETVETEYLPTKLIKRNSLRSSDKKIDKDFDRYLTEEYIDDFFDHIYYRYLNERMSKDIQGLYQKFYDMIVAILDVYRCLHENQPYDPMEVLDKVDCFLNSEALQYADMDMLVDYFDNMLEAMSATETDMDLQLEYTNINHIFMRKIIFAMDEHNNDLLDEKRKSRADMKLFVRDMLRFERGNDQSYGVLLSNLEWAGIRNAYLYTFEEPIVHLYKEQFYLPEHMLLKAALCDGEVSIIPAEEQLIHVDDLFSHRLIPTQRLSMITMPLYSEERLYGMMLCDLDDALYSDYEFLVNHISSAMKMIDILHANELIQEQLEESMAKLKEHNIVLDSISKSDMLTGIYNRRGFFEQAGQILHNNYEDGKATLVCYVDMNNLKIINDRYGHEEGDFSLRTIGDVLKKKARPGSVVARIGGDEFALIDTYEAESDVDLEFIVKDLNNAFNEFNFLSDKPYNVSVCTGGYVVSSGEYITLEQALDKADEMLYVAKQSRVKTVAKKNIRKS